MSTRTTPAKFTIKLSHIWRAVRIIAILTLFGCSSLSRSNRIQPIPAEIIEQIINEPDLQAFLHPEVEGRIPLVISDHLIEPNIYLTKFGRPVRIISDHKLSAGPFLRFTCFTVQGSTATVKLEYKIEGVAAEYLFAGDMEGSWQFREAQIWEY